MTLKTYQKSIDTLLDAYNRGELFHGNCDSCAVGTLLGSSVWSMLFMTSGTNQLKFSSFDEATRYKWCLEEDEYNSGVKTAKDIISKSGITVEELMRIEHTFEASIADTEEGYEFWREKSNQKKGQLIGLTAIINLMSTMVEDEVVDNKKDITRLESIYELRRSEVCV